MPDTLGEAIELIEHPTAGTLPPSTAGSVARLSDQWDASGLYILPDPSPLTAPRAYAGKAGAVNTLILHEVSEYGAAHEVG